MGLALEKDGVEFYVLNEKDEQQFTFKCVAIQEISRYFATLLPNMFCITIVACKKEKFTQAKFGNLVSPYAI